MKASHAIRPVFDDPNLVSAAGLFPALRLAESAGLHDLLGARLSVGSPNPVAKSVSVVGGMLAGADCIDDLDLLRRGGMGRIFGGVRAPSTLGTYLLLVCLRNSKVCLGHADTDRAGVTGEQEPEG